MTAGSDTTFSGSLNHTGRGLINMTEGGRALFSGQYSDTPDWKAPGVQLTQHNIEGMGMESAGNISFGLSVTNFKASLTSDGKTAFMNSSNAAVVFGSSESGSSSAASDDESDAVATTYRRLLQLDENTKNATKHLVGGMCHSPALHSRDRMFLTRNFRCYPNILLVQQEQVVQLSVRILGRRTYELNLCMSQKYRVPLILSDTFQRSRDTCRILSTGL